MCLRDKLLFSLLALLLFGSFVVAIQDILLPFVVAFIIAYFLDPLADKLETFKCSRTSATLIITGGFFAIAIIVSLILLPILYQQLIAFSQKIPAYTQLLHTTLAPIISDVMQQFEGKESSKVDDLLSQSSSAFVKAAGGVITNLLQSGLAMLNLLSLLFITPIVSFYILRDWDRIVAKIESWYPPAYATIIKEQTREIDHALSGYIRGQTSVCLILGTFYAIALTLAGLDFGLFIGLGTGILCFIPYVGIVFGLAIGLAVSYVQFGDLNHLLIILGIFIVGQFLEGNFITPKLVGEKVGLHPVWIIFGLLAGAALFGFIGMLLAIPVCAILGVLIRFYLKQILSKKQATT